MRISRGVVVATLVGAAGFSAPICFSIYLGWNRSVADEQARVLAYATNTLARTDGVAFQINDAFRQLAEARLPACSPAEIDLMRRLDLDSRYLQAVGRLSGDTLVCSSLDTPPVFLGPVIAVTADGVAERPSTSLFALTSSALPDSLAILSKNGFAAIVDSDLALDSFKDHPDDFIALYRPSSPTQGNEPASHARLRPEWFRAVPVGSSATFIQSGNVVALARSGSYDIGVVAVSSLSYARQRMVRFSLFFIPFGLVCGGVLAWIVASLTQKLLGLPSILRSAARRRVFTVEYQPIVCLESQEWAGAEALVRWRRNGRNIRPDLFIPAAEESGLIPLITECVAEIVARDLPSLLGIDPNFRVSINLSALDLKSPGTPDLLARMILAGGAHPSNLEIEATERGFLEVNEIRTIVSRIRSTGIRVAIDDFGTGYSSLSRLQSLDIDALKIDKSFIDTIGTDGATSQVVLHIIRMARSLHLEMVAEGVEQEAQAEFLRKMGVERAQGWLFARPMPIEDLCRQLSQRKLQHEVA